MSSGSASGALEAVDRILNRGGDADAVLRDVVEALRERGDYAWAGIFFLEDGELLPGPRAGEPDEAQRRTVAVRWQGTTVAELAVDGGADDDQELLERVAVLISAHCLVGFDADGTPWES